MATRLALLELPPGQTAADLAGGFGLPSGRPVAQQLEAAFSRRLHRLPAETQRLLLAAAADAVGDVSLLWRAAELLGIGADAASEAESAGLIELGARVRFRHPLLRAVVYRAAASDERLAVHHALAEATDPKPRPGRPSMAPGARFAGPDEQVAQELEQAADLVRGRGGISAAAAFLQRATELTSDSGRRASRALAAAQAMFRAGSFEAAHDLLASAQLGPNDDLQRARIDRLRAQILFAHGTRRMTPGRSCSRRLIGLRRSVTPPHGTPTSKQWVRRSSLVASAILAISRRRPQQRALRVRRHSHLRRWTSFWTG